MWLNIFIFLSGLGLGAAIETWYLRRKSSGVILVTKEEERTLFSLRLEATPEELESKKTIIFRIETPE